MQRTCLLVQQPLGHHGNLAPGSLFDSCLLHHDLRPGAIAQLQFRAGLTNDEAGQLLAVGQGENVCLEALGNLRAWFEDRLDQFRPAVPGGDAAQERPLERLSRGDRVAVGTPQAIEHPCSNRDIAPGLANADKDLLILPLADQRSGRSSRSIQFQR